MGFQNLKIGQRLALSFGAVIALLAIIAAITYSRVGSLNDDIGLTIKDRYPKTALMHTVNDQLNEIIQRSLNVLVMTEGHQTNSEITGIGKNTEAINAALAKLDQMANTEKGRELLKTLQETRKKFDALQARFVALVQEGKKEDARILLLSELRPAQMSYSNALDEQLTYQNELMDKSGADSKTLAERTQLLVLVLALLTGAGSILVAVLTTRSITRPLLQAVDVADRVSHGDLTSHVDTDRTDEIGVLLQSLKNMNDNLSNIVNEVRSGTEAINSASGQIASGNMDLSSRTEQQASSLEETASSMEELTSTVKQNADNARQANQLAASASEVAVSGGMVVSQVVDTMGAINDSSKKIVDIISVIDGIAFQTNILALNAAVEAARAGEQGRGFAVVAAEVRSLAQRSAGAAKEIKSLIDDSVGKVEAGSQLVDQAGSTMREVVESIRRVTDIMGEITAASNEQSAGIEQVNQAITQMDDVTQQNAALVEQAAAAAKSMQQQAGSLAQAVSVFKLNQYQRPGNRASAAPAKVAAPRPAAALSAPAKPRPEPSSAPAPRKEPVLPSKQMAVTKAGGNSDDWEEF